MILLLDNQDSFVHNLARYFRRLGCETLVIRSDHIAAADCLAMDPDAIVISPGPKGPADAGCCLELVGHRDLDVPVLGVCLGHQTIAQAFGSRIVEACPVHGMASEIQHDSSGLFAGCPTPMKVGRYHSLAVDPESLGRELKVSAWTSEGTIMGIRHRHRPILGVQFHPESVLTQHGEKIAENFVELTHCLQPKLAS